MHSKVVTARKAVQFTVNLNLKPIWQLIALDTIMQIVFTNFSPTVPCYPTSMNALYCCRLHSRPSFDILKRRSHHQLASKKLPLRVIPLFRSNRIVLVYINNIISLLMIKCSFNPAVKVKIYSHIH